MLKYNSELQIRCVKLTSIDDNSIISWPNPMFDHLLESSRWDDSNKISYIGFRQEIDILEMKIYTLSVALHVVYFLHTVIWENLVYGGANSVFLYQPYPYFIHIHLLFLNDAESKKGVYCRCSCVTEIWALIHTTHKVQHQYLITACHFRPSISRVFQNDVTYQHLISSLGSTQLTPKNISISQLLFKPMWKSVCTTTSATYTFTATTSTTSTTDKCLKVP